MPTATAPADHAERTAADGAARGVIARMRIAATRPVAASSTAVFRICFGVVAAASTVRFVANGWVDELYLAPRHHLTYARFEWVRPLPGGWMYALMAVLTVAGVAIALGWRTRWWAAAFTVGFGYTELIEASLYLNHYWFVTLAATLVVLLPTDRRWSLDAWRGRVEAAEFVPAIVVWALRAQIGVVYVFAGWAKLDGDWLLRGMPMRLWLADRTDLPVVGPLLDEPWVPIAASWAGFVFDTTIVGWLLWRRSRPFAYLAVIGFHLATGLLFRIGVFPWVMIASTLVFFAPDWPDRLRRRLVGRRDGAPPAPAPAARCATVRPAVVAVIASLALVEVVLPLRHLAYPGDVRVTEEGYYLSWRVMRTEKAGVLDFRITDPTTGATWTAGPELVLTDWQATQAAIRADLLLAAAHLVDDHYRRELGHDVEVRAESFVSVDGRPARRYVDPSIDLSAVPRTVPLHRIVL